MTLKEILNQLEQFETIQCGLFHEKVAINPNSKQPLKQNISGSGEYQRVGLCNTQARRLRIGCAHTIANKNFNDLLDEIHLADERLTAFKEQFNQIILEIYKIDHKKGDLDRDLAKALELNNSDILDEDYIRSEIAVTVKEHKALILKLENLRDSILRRVNELMV